MRHSLAIATISVAAQAAPTGALAQSVYKCGNSYQEQPCAEGARPLSIGDRRSAEQQAQSEAAARRDARLANEMEQARREAEARPAPVGLPVASDDSGTAAARAADPFTANADKPAKKGGKNSKSSNKRRAGKKTG